MGFAKKSLFSDSPLQAFGTFFLPCVTFWAPTWKRANLFLWQKRFETNFYTVFWTLIYSSCLLYFKVRKLMDCRWVFQVVCPKISSLHVWHKVANKICCLPYLTCYLFLLEHILQLVNKPVVPESVPWMLSDCFLPLSQGISGLTNPKIPTYTIGTQWSYPTYGTGPKGRKKRGESCIVG